MARNDIRAIDFYTKAAAAGHVLSQYNLGVKRRDGLGCSQDYKHSVRWFEKAAKSNYPAAMCCLGQAYENGWGVNINYWKVNSLLLMYLKFTVQMSRRVLVAPARSRIALPQHPTLH